MSDSYTLTVPDMHLSGIHLTPGCDLVAAYRRYDVRQHRTEDEFRAVMTAPGDLHWIGGISQAKTDPVTKDVTYIPKIGTFWIPATLDPELCPHPDSRDWKIAKGIGRASIKGMSCVFAECDDAPIEEQLARVQKACEAGLPWPTAIIFSGDPRAPDALHGKSVHIFWRRTEGYWLPSQVEAWQRIQRALQVVLGGDEAIINIDRRMRWGAGVTYRAGALSGSPKNPESLDPVVQTIFGLWGTVPHEDLERWAAGVAVPVDSRNSISSKSKNNSAGVVVRSRTTVVAPGEWPAELLGVEGRVDGCPWCHSTSSRVLAVSSRPDGRQFAHCFSCKGNWVEPSRNTISSTDKTIQDAVAALPGVEWMDDIPESCNTISSKERENPVAVAVPESCNTISSKGKDHTPGVATPTGVVLATADLIPNAVGVPTYMPAVDYAPTRDLAIKGTKGCGKTHLAAVLVSDLRNREFSPVIVSLAHLRSLVSGQAERLALPHYTEDCDERQIESSVAICLPSIERVPLFTLAEDFGDILPRRVDLLIIDEIVSVKHNFPGTMDPRKSRDVHTHLESLISSARRVVVLDADLDADTIAWVEGLRGGPLFVVEVQTQDPCTYEITSDPTAWLKEVYDAWDAGERLAIYKTSTQGVRALAQSMEERRPGSRVLAVCSETIQDLPDLRTISDWIGDYDAIVYSPTCGTGVTIDDLNFDRVFGSVSRHTVTSQAAHQGLRRVRRPKNRNILIHADGGGRIMTTDPEVIRGQFLRREWSTQRRVGLLHKQPLPPQNTWIDGRFEQNRAGSRYLDHYSHTLAYQRVHGVLRPFECLVGYLGDLDTAVELVVRGDSPMTPDERKEVRAPLTLAREEIDEADKDEIEAAEDLDPEVAKAIKEPKDREERVALRKHRVREFYGRVDRDILDFDTRGKGRKKARAYAAISLICSGDGQKITARDAKAIKDGCPTAHLRHEVLTASATVLALRALGILVQQGDRTLQWNVDELDPETICTAARRASSTHTGLGAMLAGLGLQPPPTAAKNPIPWVGTMLRRLGLGLSKTRQVQIGKNPETGKRIYRRHYALDCASLAEITAHSKHHRQGMMLSADTDESGARPDWAGAVGAALDCEDIDDGTAAEVLF